jgi:hypothetical protein
MKTYTPSGKVLADQSTDSANTCNINAVSYRPPSQFTLRADNSGGLGGENAKQPSFDGIVEAILGTLGTVFMSVLQFPNGAGTVAKENGTNIFGGEVLGAYLSTYGVVIQKLQASGSEVTTNSLSRLTVNRYLGNIQGVDRGDLELNIDQNISTAVPTLSLTRQWTFTGNTALQVTNMTTNILDLTFFCLGLRPYTSLV